MYKKNILSFRVFPFSAFIRRNSSLGTPSRLALVGAGTNPKSVTLALDAPYLTLSIQCMHNDWFARCRYDVTGGGIVFQSGSTMKSASGPRYP